MKYYLIIPLIFLLLYLGKFLILPLLFSFLIFILLRSVSNKISSINAFGYSLNYYVSFFIVCLGLFLFFYFIGALVDNDISKVIADTYIYQKNIQEIISTVKTYELNSSLFSTDNFFKNLDLKSILSNTLNFFTNAAGNISLIIIYLIFFLIEEKFFKIKLEKISSNKSTKKILEKINKQIYEYFEIKILTSFFTGILTFLILLALSNNLAVLFGIFSFLLNFIPFIGSLIAIVLPVIFSIVQSLDFSISVLTIVSLIFVQLLIGNFIEPKLMGKSLNLSPIIMIISLGIFGKIWGIAGMFLSVPILVVMLIIFSNFNQTKKIAIFLSEKGNIK